MESRMPRPLACTRVGPLAVAGLVAALAGTQTALALQVALPEVLLLVDTSQSMQYRVGTDVAPTCASNPLTDQKSRWTVTREMIGGSFPGYRCQTQTLATLPESLTPPPQVLGAAVCIGGLSHYDGPSFAHSTFKVPAPPVGQSPIGTAHNGTPGAASTTTARVLEDGIPGNTRAVDAAFFQFDLTPIPTTRAWATGSVTVMGTVNTLTATPKTWSMSLVMASPDPQPPATPPPAHACAAFNSTRTVLSNPVVVTATAVATKMTFTLTTAGLTALLNARKGGQMRVWLTIAGTKTLYGVGCTKLARTTTVLTNITFNVTKTAPIDQQPTLNIQTGVLCPAEGPTTHSVAQGLDLAGLYGTLPIGRDGLLDIFGSSAKFALLAGDHALSQATSPAGGYTYGPVLASVWGNINAGMADPYLPGTTSVPVSSKDTLADRATTYTAIQASLKTIQPNGPTPLAQQLEDALAYFGPSATMDPHFKTTAEDAIKGDPYRVCRKHVVALFSDGGSKLYNGTSDGRVAAIQAASKLFAANAPVYVLAVGHPAVAGTPPAADLKFLDDLALAGGTQKAWPIKTPGEAVNVLGPAIADSSSLGEVFTKPVVTTATGSATDVQHVLHAASIYDISQPLRTRGVVEQRMFRCNSECNQAGQTNRTNVCEVINYQDVLRLRKIARRLYTHKAGLRLAVDKTTLTAADLGIATVGIGPKLELAAADQCVTAAGYNLSLAAERDLYRDHVLETLSGAPKSCREKHPLGAPSRAQPVILDPAAKLGLRDPSFQLYAARVVPAKADYTDLNPPGSAVRATMAFVATHDGLLHAFRTDVDPKIKTLDLALAGDEMWAFLPRFNLTRISQMKLVTEPNASYLGGSIVAGHVLLTRTNALPKDAAKQWRAIVIVGAGEAGAGYTALDVTAPDDPRVLWEITPDTHCWGSVSVGGQPGPTCAKVNTYQAMGRSTGKPALTALFFKKNGVLAERTVAVLPFGKAPSQAAVSNLGSEGLGDRGAFVVDVASGELVRELKGVDLDTTALQTPIASVADLGHFWGDPSCFDGSPGQVTTRCFIGDSRGVLWRLDLSSDTSAKWTMKAFFDAYSGSDVPVSIVLPMTSTQRAPVIAAPSLAMRGDGSLNIVYGTGGVDETANATRRHVVYALAEVVQPATNIQAQKVLASRAWYKVQDPFERFVGPAVVFGGNAYWAAHTVAAVTPCDTGTARMYGVRFDRRKSASDPASLQGAFPTPGQANTISANAAFVALGAYRPSPAFVVPVPACRGSCAPGDVKCVSLNGGLLSGDRPRYEVGVGVAGAVQGPNQTPPTGTLPVVGTVVQEMPVPRTTVVLTGWDLLLE
ncbi:MAG: hypothetical protein EXR79_13220 [Myxococcales bacterium]|nr:hypothetical protein [Myxococcales bacterium]